MTGAFDTGVFLILMSIAIISMLTSSKVGSLFLLMGSAIFVFLGLILVTGDNVVSYKLTNDGTTIINETNYFISSTMVNQSTQWLGWIFFVFGLVAGAKFLADLNDHKPLL